MHRGEYNNPNRKLDPVNDARPWATITQINCIK